MQPNNYEVGVESKQVRPNIYKLMNEICFDTATMQNRILSGTNALSDPS